MRLKKSLYKFKDRKNGYTFYSRHKRPDITAYMTSEQVEETFEITEITDQEEIAKHTY